MEAIFSQEEMAYLETKNWWVACTKTPYLIRMGVLKETILLSICNMKQLWATRIDKPTLLKQKQIYAKSLEVSGFSELISLFNKILSNPESRALYHFVRKNQQILIFRVEKQIQVYPFQWKFQLVSIPSDIPYIICKDLLNPMTRTLQAQEKRILIMKKKMEILERDLLKKMTDPEKNRHRSVLIEDQEDLKLLVAQPKQDQYISDLRLDSISRMLFTQALQSALPKTKLIPDRNSKDNKNNKSQKVSNIGMYSQMGGQQLINELQMKKQEERDRKKKKKLDFI